ncbi:MAG: mechanosensitive ion channel family protein [Oscillospiraceae bacterium]|nr:mechanosensitive ion channel family protein [Oscillospiraceae bacterium]
MENLIDSVKKYFTEATADAVLKVVGSVLVLFLGFALIKWLVKAAARTKAAQRMDPSLLSFLRSFISIGLKILLIFSVADNLGVPTTSFLTLLGSAGIAIGLSLQGSLSNMAGGLMILLFRQFKVGDFIEAPGGYSGTVADISIFYTTLTTVDNRKIVIPNGTLSNGVITNYNAQDKRRVDIEFSVGYGSDIEGVKRILLETACAHKLALREPAPFARMTKQGDSALVFTLRVWCSAADYWPLFFDLNEQVKQAFDANGIAIPFPQMDVHLDK